MRRGENSPERGKEKTRDVAPKVTLFGGRDSQECHHELLPTPRGGYRESKRPIKTSRAEGREKFQKEGVWRRMPESR